MTAKFGPRGAKRERMRVAAVRPLLHHFARDCQRDAEMHTKRALAAGKTEKWAAHSQVAMRYRRIADAYLLAASGLSTDDRLDNEFMKELTKALRRV